MAEMASGTSHETAATSTSGTTTGTTGTADTAEATTSAPVHEAGRFFQLRPDVAFLNHGSFGACPRPVFETYQRWQRDLEAQPVEFLQRRLPGLLAEARERLGAYVGARAEDLVFVPNATHGMNI